MAMGNSNTNTKRTLEEAMSKERLSIEEYGYEFQEVNDQHKLRDIKTGKNFKFDVYREKELNQQRYEEIGEAITEYVYEHLEKMLKLKRVHIPVLPADAGPNEPKGFFFMSENALKSDKLMILIHGSGVVRAGQWARSLIINNSFEAGTMVPYIERAKEEGFGVLITNGNHNYDEKLHKCIKGSENPQDHFVYVWNNFIKKAKAKHIVIVAHSFGGVVVLHGLRNIKEAKERIKAVAFTDSVHSVGHYESSDIKQFFKERTRNWVSSREPLDTPIRSYYKDDTCELVSAGTTEHVWTSHCAKDSVFSFFKEKLDKEEKGKDNDKCAGNGSRCGSDDCEEDDQEGLKGDEQQLETGPEDGKMEKENSKDEGSENDNMVTGDDPIAGTPGEETVQQGKDNMVTGDGLITGTPGEESVQPGKDNMLTGDGSITGTPGEESVQQEKDNMVTGDGSITGTPREETVQQEKR
ncbi:cotranscriptional regulator FAM172A-like [Actinia tenebrosa]|uniref:Cotranscriptional regulator FAM172A-like n=1 Tax=Actinia tenebrosa TaxID=6105 RepID=A0A6P8IIY8_ACTTE|nr:cotranscriptional regulator FAM172A-like [Actinia tenebrosa]